MAAIRCYRSPGFWLDLLFVAVGCILLIPAKPVYQEKEKDIHDIQHKIGLLDKKLSLDPEEAEAVWDKVLKAFTDKYPKNTKNTNRFRVLDTVQNFTMKEITANAQKNPKIAFQTTLRYELADHYA